MKRNYTFIPLLPLLIIAIVACSNKSSKPAADNDSEDDATKATVQAPQFSADSAYQYIQTQADFGPRVPNTAAHKACGEFLAKKLEEFGAKVYNQHADLVAYDNTILKARNVIGAYNPESKKRVLLCAHWDSRPYADQDADKTKHHSPILGVNDGASGAGVLLEVARQLQQQAPAIGIDIIFFDAEDYGIPYFYQGAYKNDTWVAVVVTVCRFWYSSDLNCATCVLYPTELTFARLLAIVSTFACCAFIPVAADHKLLTII